MKQKYRLLPVQVENLRKQYDESLSKLQTLNVMKNTEASDKKGTTDSEINFSADTSLLGALSITSRAYKEAKERLECYELLENKNSDIIDLGSTFEVEMNYDGIVENEVFTLVEIRNHKDDHSFISIDSPLGQAVAGTQVGDAISYMVGKERITGTVTGIVKEKQKTL